jgi:hypothetical protein
MGGVTDGMGIGDLPCGLVAAHAVTCKFLHEGLIWPLRQASVQR